MDQSKPVTPAQHFVPSPDGVFVATLQRSSLIIHSTKSDHPLQAWSLPIDFVSQCKCIRWSRALHTTDTNLQRAQDIETQFGAYRVLLAGDDTIRVYDVADPTWHGSVDGAASGMGKVANVGFGCSSNEILVFSDFGVKVTIWSLVTKRGIEIRDPKYAVQCYDYRPRTGHLALLTRAMAQETLLILKPGSYEVVRSVELASIDAQEVKWSMDGHWLAVRDTASAGPRVYVYTSDGHLFRTYTGSQDLGDVALGVKCLQWTPAGLLLIGDYDGIVTILNKNIFSPMVLLRHPTTINMPDVAIWEEQINVTKDRSYVAALQPANPPTSTSLAMATAPRSGISLMTCNPDGPLLATRNDIVPTTVWIWSLQTGRALAVLIHHSPIRQLAWHPTASDVLLVQCAIPQPVAHLWRPTWESPRVATLPLERANGRLDVRWLQSRNEDLMNIAIGSAHQFITVDLSHSGEVIQISSCATEGAKSFGIGPENMFDEGNSLDLSPIRISHETVEIDGREDNLNESRSGFGMTNEAIDDTFHYRRQVKATG